MAKLSLFQYAVLWHPTEEEAKDKGLKTELVLPVDHVLASSPEKVLMIVGSKISKVPKEYQDNLEQLEIVIRPF